MSVITSHGVTLRGENGLVLRPLTDGHLPLLYRWNADPEVLYWVEEDDVSAYDEEAVRAIYGGVSRNAHCFLIEADGVPIGECWLQRMNLASVLSMYPPGTDVRRIDICIGEKAYWGKGFGTAAVRLLTGFAFEDGTEVIHCLCDDYNVRSCRMWEKLGFELVEREALEAGQKGKYQHHYRMCRLGYERILG
ncbi:MAG: GNAT family N-acetyltransferase [Clostridia bacterium]|nr:GNAT family N-acetyltransferase [Clostridia bacterium]